MRTDQLVLHFREELAPLLGAGEAASVTRLVMEDVFVTRRGSRPRQLSQSEVGRAEDILLRLKSGEPVQYVTGIADFYGLQLRVTPAVLIPRPETEELVEWVLGDHPGRERKRAVDLGTGSGCIPLALKSRRPSWYCEGWDISEAAIAVAIDNRERLALEVTFGTGDMRHHDAFSSGDGCDILISNPPYIPPSEREKMGTSTLRYEPALALFTPEADPLLYYRHVATTGWEVLVDDGRLYLEVNEFNSERVVALLRGIGYVNVQRRRDLQGKWRMVGAIRPPTLAR